jgi:hypothetical protein
MKLKRGSYYLKPASNSCLQLFALVPLLVVLRCEGFATSYQVNFGGTLYYTSGNHWDSSIHTGTPFAFSLTYSTPPPETYNFSGYSTYVYRGGSATMAYQIGTNLFSAGRVDVSVWNNMLYSGSRIDGYHLFTDTGSSPGFDYVQFYVALQSSNTNLLANTGLPLSAFPLANFDRMALAALNVSFSGYSYPDNLGYLEGSITSFSITEVPEPSVALLALLGGLFALRKCHAK